MSWIAWWMLAVAAEQGCELRGLPVRVVYEASGVVTVYDVDEVLAEVETGGLKVEETRVSCSGDRIRLVQGGNVDEEGAHSALSIDAIDLNFAPVLDALPAERFDPHAAGVRRFRPIMLTSLTTFLGLTPMILEQSAQARFLVPMAISLGFGVLFATFIILLLVPALYLMIEDVRPGGTAPGAEHDE